MIWTLCFLLSPTCGRDGEGPGGPHEGMERDMPVIKG